MAGNVAVYVARQMPERHKENFLLSMTMTLSAGGTDEGKRAFLAARRADAAATAQWIVEISDEKARLFSGKNKGAPGGLWKGESG